MTIAQTRVGPETSRQTPERGAPWADSAPPFAVAVTLQQGETQFPALIAALASQSGLAGRRVTVFAAPGDWERLARPILDSVPDDGAIELRLIRPPCGHSTGAATLAAVAAAATHLAALSAREEPVLLVTDAAARPAPDWVRCNLEAIGRGADMVCGAVLPLEPVEPELARGVELMRRYRRMVVALEDRIDPVPSDPAPRHGDESGMSLALRLSCLQRAGGVPEAAVLADRQLIARVRMSGAVIRHAGTCRVHVPTRIYLGQAPGAPAGLPGAADPDRLARLYRERARLRALLGARLAGLHPAERERAVRASLALTGPAMQTPAASVPLALALEKLEVRAPWRTTHPRNRLPRGTAGVFAAPPEAPNTGA